MFINVPKEIIGEIFNELDGVALTKCSLVCFRWNKISIKKKTWKKICHQEIDSPTLKEILYKTSPALKLISWQHLYRSWYLTTNHSHRWTLKKNNVMSFGGNLKINQAVIINGYVIVTVGEIFVHLYCLETQKWSDSYQLAEKYYNFKPIELKGQVYLVFLLLGYFFNLLILKVERGTISNHQSLALPKFGGRFITVDFLDNNNLIRIQTGGTKKLYRLEQDPSDSNLVILQFVTDVNFWYCIWNDLLVRETQDEVTLYSIQRNSISVKATIPITNIDNESYHPFFVFYCTPRTLFLLNPKRYYEISEANGDYKINVYEYSPSRNYGALRFNQRFSNIFLTSVERNSDIEDFNTIMFYNLSNIIEYLLFEDYKVNQSPSDVQDICFHNDELVIIRTNRDKINIQRCSFVGTISSAQNPTPKRICSA